MNDRVPTEAEEGRALVAYLRLRRIRFTHIANETGTNARFQGIRNKQQGVAKGFPDYLVWVNGKMIAIELKRLRGASIRPEQREWIDFLNSVGTPATVCKGWVAAKEFIELHESQKKNSDQEF